MALILEDDSFRHIIRLHNTNVSGKEKVAYALTAIKGIGRRFAHVACKRAGIDLNKRAGELTESEIENLKAVIENPGAFDIPTWFLNRQKDRQTGKSFQNVSNEVDTALRTDIERMKKIRLHRGLRHTWNVRVRGQHTCTTGRHRKGGAVVTGKKA